MRAFGEPQAPITGVLALKSGRLTSQLVADNAPRLSAVALTGLAVLLPAGVDAFAQGRLNTRLTPAGTEENASLGRAFNAMAEALERTCAWKSEMVKEAAAQVESSAWPSPIP